MEFGDGTVHLLGEGGMARVDAATVRKIRNVGEVEAVYLCAGGKDGYVGRDGRAPRGRGGAPAGAPRPLLRAARLSRAGPRP